MTNNSIFSYFFNKNFNVWSYLAQLNLGKETFTIFIITWVEASIIHFKTSLGMSSVDEYFHFVDLIVLLNDSVDTFSNSFKDVICCKKIVYFLLIDFSVC